MVKASRGPDCRPNDAGRAGRTCGNWRVGSANARGAAAAGLTGPYSGHLDGRLGRHPQGSRSLVGWWVGGLLARRCRMTELGACGSPQARWGMSGVGRGVEEIREKWVRWVGREWVACRMGGSGVERCPHREFSCCWKFTHREVFVSSCCTRLLLRRILSA